MSSLGLHLTFRGSPLVRGCREKAHAGETPAPSPLTLAELVDEYLDQHVAEANTIRGLRDRLRLATEGIPVTPRRHKLAGDGTEERLDEAREIPNWKSISPCVAKHIEPLGCAIGRHVASFGPRAAREP